MDKCTRSPSTHASTLPTPWSLSLQSCPHAGTPASLWPPERQEDPRQVYSGGFHAGSCNRQQGGVHRRHVHRTRPQKRRPQWEILHRHRRMQKHPKSRSLGAASRRPRPRVPAGTRCIHTWSVKNEGRSVQRYKIASVIRKVLCTGTGSSSGTRDRFQKQLLGWKRSQVNRIKAKLTLRDQRIKAQQSRWEPAQERPAALNDHATLFS